MDKQDKQVQEFTKTWTTGMINKRGVKDLTPDELRKVAKILEKVK